MSSGFRIPDYVKYWDEFSGDYLDAARLFADNALKIEQKYGTPDHISKVNMSATAEQIVYVTSSFFSVNACLSASIDEVFREADALNRHIKPQSFLSHLSPKVIKDMADARNAKVIKPSNYPDLDLVLQYSDNTPYWKLYPLDKFQLALYLSDLNKEGKPFDFGDDVWKDVEFLHLLRNYLVHYEPEWVEYRFSNGSYYAKQKTVDVMDGLQIRGFRSGLYPKHAEFHEGSIRVRLGADCAAWAVEATSDFLYAFYEKMPIDDRKMWLYHRRVPF